LQEEKTRGLSKCFVTLIVDCETHDAPSMASILHQGEIIGEVTSSGYGYRIDAAIALEQFPKSVTRFSGKNCVKIKN